jgi:hypothetical protein
MGTPLHPLYLKSREEVVTGTIINRADYYLQKGGDPNSLFAEIVQILPKAIQLRQDEKIIRTNKQR